MTIQQPVFQQEGPYRTHIMRTASLTESWWWSVTDQRVKGRVRSGRSSSLPYAKHDARRALDALKRDDAGAQAA